MARRCPRCGKELSADLLVCPDDGTALEAAPEEQTAVDVPPLGTGVWEAVVQRDILIGTQVGEYVVRRQIGAGGMGIVYEAEQPQIGRKVAVKVLRPDVGRMQPASLVGEARASGRIRHPAIVDVFGYGEIPSIGQYIVMEYLEGKPLDALLEERGGALSVPEVLWLLDGVLAGLCAAHAEGVIHRDLKPSNLFLESASGGSQHVKILDFGLAKTQYRDRDPKTPSTIHGKVIGTPEYMAPEQVRRQQITERTDLYSLGVIAFQMLTGERPFRGETALEVAVAQVQDLPPKPSQLAPVPEELDALVLQLLEKDPQRRPADAAAVRREVKELIQQLGTVTKVGKPPGPQAGSSAARVERAGPVESDRSPAPAAPARRGRALWPWVVIAVVSLAGGGAWGLLGSQPAPAPPAPVNPVGPVIPEPAATVPAAVPAPAPAPAPVAAPEATRPPAPAPRPWRRAPPASAEPTREALLKRIAELKLRVQSSAPPGGSPDPMMLALLARQDAAARSAVDGPARARVARSLDAFEHQFERSGDLKSR
ncbi:MAG TPA: serine/threonine-protein kinase [Myxococcales bacterium]|nr:serine/threonine-protein kinase [Myxococcales bacterium]